MLIMKGLNLRLSQDVQTYGQSFFHNIWTPEKVKDYRTAATGDRRLSRILSLELMNRGIFLLGHPNISALSTENDVSFLLEKISESVASMKPEIQKVAPQLLR